MEKGKKSSKTLKEVDQITCDRTKYCYGYGIFI